MLAGAAVLAGLVMSAPGAQAAPLNGPPAGSHCVNNGAALFAGDTPFHVYDGANLIRLSMQADGNLVLSYNSTVLWAVGGNAGIEADMRSDGNFVVYDDYVSGSDYVKSPLWASNTSNWADAYLCLQPDANLVIYGGDWYPVWATNTSR